jgi:hypothetical protein
MLTLWGMNIISWSTVSLLIEQQCPRELYESRAHFVQCANELSGLVAKTYDTLLLQAKTP